MYHSLKRLFQGENVGKVGIFGMCKTGAPDVQNSLQVPHNMGPSAVNHVSPFYDMILIRLTAMTQYDKIKL